MQHAEVGVLEKTQEHPITHPLDGPKHVGCLALRVLPGHAEKRTKTKFHRGALETLSSPRSRRHPALRSCTLEREALAPL